MNGHSAPALSVRNLSYEIDGKALLDGVDLQVDRGKFVGLIGPNGAGKTTLLRTLGGIVRDWRGDVRLEGMALGSLTSKEVSERLALVPQVAPYTHGFITLELVLMGRYPHLGRFQIEGHEDDRIAREAMRLTKTEQFADRTLDTLSGGERQRVFVARAMAQQPRILLLDEPTANLDVLHQLRVLELVRRLVDDGLTAVAAFHDLHVAARYCDRLVVIKEGRVRAQGMPEEVLTPGTLRSVFGVEAAVNRDTSTGGLSISLIGPAEQFQANGISSTDRAELGTWASEIDTKEIRSP